MRSGINFGMLLRVMGLLVIIEAAFMAVPLVTSLVYGDAADHFRCFFRGYVGVYYHRGIGYAGNRRAFTCNPYVAVADAMDRGYGYNPVYPGRCAYA